MYKKLISILIVLMLVGPIAASAAVKIGVVDGESLFDEYPAAQVASEKIAKAQEELRATIAESEKKYSDFEKTKKSEADKLNKQRELQAQIDVKAKSTKKMIEELSGKLEDDILSAIKKIASQKGLDIIMDKRAILVGGVDISEEVSAELKKMSSSGNKDKK